LVRVTDALALRPGADLSDDAPSDRAELVRSAVVLDGQVNLQVELEPRGGATARTGAGGLLLRPSRRRDLELHLRSNRRLDGLTSAHQLRAGDRLDLVLSWGDGQRPHRYHRFDPDAMLAATATADAWRR
jgi:hypothetical protein